MDKQYWREVLESLRTDIAQVGPTLRDIAEEVIDEGISEYPIFVATQQPLDLGRAIPDLDEVPLTWQFRASLLEELVKRKVVQPDHVYRFQRTYDNPRRKACVFVITEVGAQFVFVPYELT
jgi:hypothetical protein